MTSAIDISLIDHANASKTESSTEVSSKKKDMTNINAHSMLHSPSAISNIYGLGISSDKSLIGESSNLSNSLMMTKSPSKYKKIDEYNKENQPSNLFCLTAHKYEDVITKLYNLINEKNLLSNRLADIESSYNEQLHSQSETIEILRKSNDQLSKQLFLSKNHQNSELSFSQRLKKLESSLEIIIRQREKWAHELEKVRTEMAFYANNEDMNQITEKKDVFNQSNNDLSVLEANNGELMERIESLNQKIQSMSSSNMQLARPADDSNSMDLRQEIVLPGQNKSQIMQIDQLDSEPIDLISTKIEDSIFPNGDTTRWLSSSSPSKSNIGGFEASSGQRRDPMDKNVQDDSYVIDKGMTLMTELLQLYHQLFNKMEKKEQIIREKLDKIDDDTTPGLHFNNGSQQKKRESSFFSIFIVWSAFLLLALMVSYYIVSIIKGPPVVPY